MIVACSLAERLLHPRSLRAHGRARVGCVAVWRIAILAGLFAAPPFHILPFHACALSQTLELQAAEPSVSRESVDAAFREKLKALARKCDELGLDDAASSTRGWLIERDPQRQYVFLPPNSSGPHSSGPKPRGDANRLTQLWSEKFRELRNAQASALFSLAKQSLSEGHADTAFQLLHEVLREDPEHADARRILGFTRSGSRWLRKEREVRATVGLRNQLQFGWRRRAYWVVESENYRILTSHGKKAGVELAGELERLHDVWRQAFFSFWGSESALRSRFAGRSTPLAPRRRYQVVLFRDRQEYLDRMGRVEPRIAKTVGYYLARKNTAYFYAGDASNRSTWYHEATHQLFQESIGGVTDPGEEDNFWIVEGAALYMESLRWHGDHCRLGGWDANRLQFSRYRALFERFQIPLREFVGFDRQRLQQDDDIRRLYSQAAGITHFLMNGRAGAYRRGAVAYIRDVYEGDAKADSLFTRLGAAPEQLDKDYREFLNVTDADMKFLDSPSETRNLCFSHTSVTDDGLRILEECDALRWLDLAHTKATDATIARLAGADGLRQLSLEKTGIGDAALDTVGKLAGLRELDLSETMVTDEGLERLRGLSRLTVLWLTGTRITDAGLARLQSLRQLETLDVSRTKVTQEAWEALRRKLPKLSE